MVPYVFLRFMKVVLRHLRLGSHETPSEDTFIESVQPQVRPLNIGKQSCLHPPLAAQLLLALPVNQNTPVNQSSISNRTATAGITCQSKHTCQSTVHSQ